MSAAGVVRALYGLPSSASLTEDVNPPHHRKGDRRQPELDVNGRTASLVRSSRPAAVERFFERLFERPATRLFQPQVEVVQIQRALERVMESERHVQSRKSYVPTTYRVLLNDEDVAALDGDLRALATDLAESLRVYARAHGYVLLAQPSVQIGSSSTVQPSDVRAFADAVEPPANGAMPGPLVRPIDVPPKPQPDFVREPTAVYRAPATTAPRAQLAVRAPGHAVTRFTVRAGTLRLGRALDNDIVLADDRVSRHHGQVAVRLGMLVYTDLGSTNGSLLNGAAVREIALGPGDVLQLGSSTVTIEPTS